MTIIQHVFAYTESFEKWGHGRDEIAPRPPGDKMLVRIIECQFLGDWLTVKKDGTVIWRNIENAKDRQPFATVKRTGPNYTARSYCGHHKALGRRKDIAIKRLAAAQLQAERKEVTKML